MNSSYLRAGLLSLCLLSTGCPGPKKPPPQVDVSQVVDPLQVRQHTLQNGMKVYITQNDQEPRFYAEIAVRAGSKHDPSTATGLAHYLEHLLFKGTNKMGTTDYQKEKALLDQIRDVYQQRFVSTDPEERAQLYSKITELSKQAAGLAIPNELDRLFKELGGTNLNAHTWHEETVYKIGLPSNKLKQWAQIETDRFKNPVFRLFQPELEIVYEEKNRSMDNKYRALNTAMNEAMFPVHPYGQQPTIGTVEHLKNPSIVEIEKYFQTYYVPGNMAVFISGDVDVDETIAILEESLGTLPAKPMPSELKFDDPGPQGIQRISVDFVAEPMVMLMFRTVDNLHPDKPALQLLDMILDNRTAGLINLNLTQKQAVREAGSRPTFMNDAGVQVLYGVPKKGQTHKEVEDLLLSQIEKIKNGEFDDWLIPAIVNDYVKSRMASLEENTSRVSMMRRSYINGQNWEDIVNEIEKTEKLTKQDIVDVANKYFGENYVAGYRHNKQQELPKIDKPQLDKVPIDPSIRSPYVKEILAMPSDDIKPTFISPEKDYTISEISPGVKLYHATNPINELFQLTIRIENGLRQNNSLRIAAEVLSNAGFEGMEASALQQEWYKLGSSFSVSVGSDATLFRLTGLDKNFQASVSLMAKVVQTAQVPDETVEKLLQIWLGTRKDQRVGQRQIISAMGEKGMYGEQSSFLSQGTDEEIQSLTGEKLLTDLSQLLQHDAKAIYTGTLSKESVATTLKESLLNQEKQTRLPEYQPRPINTPENTEIRFHHKEMAQAQVLIQFAGEPREEDDLAVIEVFNNYFGLGMNSIVFQELRESRALAYTAYGYYREGSHSIDKNIMIGYIGTQADKTTQALSAFIDLIDNLPKSESRFDSVKNALLTRYSTTKTSFRDVLSSVLSWEMKGLTTDPRPQRIQNIEQLTMQQVVDFHQKHIKDRPKIISIVGDKSKINLEELGKFGSVKEVSEQDIFRY